MKKKRQIGTKRCSFTGIKGSCLYRLRGGGSRRLFLLLSCGRRSLPPGFDFGFFLSLSTVGDLAVVVSTEDHILVRRVIVHIAGGNIIYEVTIAAIPEAAVVVLYEIDVVIIIMKVLTDDAVSDRVAAEYGITPYSVAAEMKRIAPKVMMLLEAAVKHKTNEEGQGGELT